MSRYVGEVVELTAQCELGDPGERAVVTWIEGHYMTLVFPNRPSYFSRKVNTGTDYRFLRTV